MFDCKNPKCQELLDDNAPFIFDHISDKDSEHFNTVLSILDSMDIPYTHDKKLVRGLDYYTQTTFEITSSILGAQDALCGGGRYDKLVEELGGKSTPAIGFAAGMERLFIAIESNSNNENERSVADVYFISLGQKATKEALKISEYIREKYGVRVITETLQRSLKAQMREANRMNVQFVVILGDEELEKNIAVIKNMDTGDQDELTLEELPHYFVVDGHQ